MSDPIKSAYFEGFSDGAYNECESAKPFQYVEKSWSQSETYKSSLIDLTDEKIIEIYDREIRAGGSADSVILRTVRACMGLA